MVRQILDVLGALGAPASVGSFALALGAAIRGVYQSEAEEFARACTGGGLLGLRKRLEAGFRPAPSR